jgi:hypothetical protein
MFTPPFQRLSDNKVLRYDWRGLAPRYSERGETFTS